MNLTLNSFAPMPAATEAAAPVPAARAQDGATAQGMAPAAFAQWLDLAPRADAAQPLPETAEVTDRADAALVDVVEASDNATVPDQQVVLMGAMQMPLMAPPQAPVAARAAGAGPADQPAGEGAATAPLTAAELRTGLVGATLPAAAPVAPSAEPAGRAAPVAPSAEPAGSAAPVALSTEPAGRAAPVALSTEPAGSAAPVAPSAGPAGSAAQPAAKGGKARLAGLPGATAEAPGAEPRAATATAPAPAQPAARALEAKPAADATPVADAAAPSSERGAGGWGVAGAPSTPASAAARAAADSSVTLAGPPAAWRQTLHEALGDRLNLQLTSRAEQAVIRLEPPMLGRVDIAIRHSAGTLEVTISATHGEVLRQLNAVSDNLRSDLAARQFSEVAVTVTQAPRSAQAHAQGDAQGRGRQPGREDQPKDPGRALADAGDPASTFSLNGRA